MVNIKSLDSKIVLDSYGVQPVSEQRDYTSCNAQYITSGMDRHLKYFLMAIGIVLVNALVAEMQFS